MSHFIRDHANSTEWQNDHPMSLERIPEAPEKEAAPETLQLIEHVLKEKFLLESDILSIPCT